MTTLSTEPNKLAYLFVALLVTFFAIALLVDPAADPPLGVSDLEGQVLIGAKSLVPGHNVPLDDWNPALVSPTQVALTTWAYRVFGVSLEVARSLTAGVSLLVVVLFFLLVRRMNPTVAILATALLVLNPIF
ncbi:MAG: hypothetical protein HKN21_14005, partial [Candidatus Eisenbacteria bacterium]|nr:hypothetical protein [Candidatus Eisenbacteria bacterium]